MAYLADVLQIQAMVEPWFVGLSAARSDNDVVDAVILLKCLLKEAQDRLVVGHVGVLEGRPGWLGRESRI
jgi:hypothetical protein